VIGEYQAQIGIEPLRVLKGNLPPPKLSVVLSWAETRTAALVDTWYIVTAKKKPEKIL
jgi:hypothetical protein